jgi:hypothetical protein
MSIARRVAAAVVFLILADTAAAMVSPLCAYLAGLPLVAVTAWRTAVRIEQDRLAAARQDGAHTRKDRNA